MPSTLASTLAIKERGALAPVCPAVRTEPEFIDVAVMWLDVIADFRRRDDAELEAERTQ